MTEPLPRLLTVALVVICAGCSGRPDVPDQPLTAAVEEPRARSLEELLDAAWKLDLDLQPIRPRSVQTTHLGHLPRASMKAHAEHAERLLELATEASSTGDSPVGARFLAFEADATREVLLACKHPLWQVGAKAPNTPARLLAWFVNGDELNDEEARANYERRLRHIPFWLSEHEDALREGASRGYVASAADVRSAVDKLGLLAVVPADQNPLTRGRQVGTRYKQTFELHVKPALERYVRFLDEDLSATASTDPGIHRLPTGSQCYDALFRYRTGGSWEPEMLELRATELMEDSTREAFKAAKASGVERPALRATVREMRSKHPLASMAYRVWDMDPLASEADAHPWIVAHQHPATVGGIRMLGRSMKLAKRDDDHFLDFERWLQRVRIAAIFVVDVRLHSGRLDREQAVRFLIDEAGFAEREARDHVDRVAADPARASANVAGTLAFEDALRRASASHPGLVTYETFAEAASQTGGAPFEILLHSIATALEIDM